MNSLERQIELGLVNCFGGGGGSTEAKPTAEMVEQTKINSELWDYYVSEYKPTIEKYGQQIQADAPSRSEQYAGYANAETMKSIAGPVSTSPVVNARVLSEKARAGAMLAGNAEDLAKKENIVDAQRLIDIGRGQATSSADKYSTLAAGSVRSLISDTENAYEENASSNEAIASVAGAGAAYLNYKK